MSNSQAWKTPNEILKLQRLKQKKKALQARFDKKDANVETDKASPLETQFLQKRKNPFVKENQVSTKKQKVALNPPELRNEDTLFELIAKPQPKKGLESSSEYGGQQFGNFAENDAEEEEFEELKPNIYLPIDWSMHTRMRILSKTPLPGTALKTTQEASGLTGFVRCTDLTNTPSGLDTSVGARFHQSTLYWQHPHLPWLTLFPRNSKANVGYQIGETERASLSKDWAESFHGLFQLLRAKQCPFFYVCANVFTVLFRAAGIGGLEENHAILTPTSRGFRNALRQEEIEFTQPLKKDANLNKSNEGNNSLTNAEETQDVADENNDEDDEMEEEKWLESLGVDANEIKRISAIQARKEMGKEMSEDFSDTSLILIRGEHCQAFFNFLLNAKTTIPNVGRLAGVPPTLLAPVAFPLATLRNLQKKSSKLRVDGVDYFSIELRGVILPHILPYICNLLKATKDSFSATMAANLQTLALTKATMKLIEGVTRESPTPDQVFSRENLSDCGLHPSILESMCRVGPKSVAIMERMCYSTEHGGYTWS